MKRPLLLARSLLPTALSLVAAPAAAAEGAEAANFDAYGLTLEQFEKVRSSESPIDFGGLPSAGETDQLWSDAVTFEYEVAMSHASNHSLTSPGYHPYLVCSTYEGMSGFERIKKMNETFQGTPGVEASHIYTNGNLYYNEDDMSCGVLRAFNDTIRNVYEANPGLEKDMTTTPLHTSMKMTANTVDLIQSVMDGTWEEGEDAVSISGGDGDGGGLGRIEAPVMGINTVLCPGVQEFDGADVPDKQIEDDVRDFVTGGGGGTVKDLSFYYRRVIEMEDGETAVHTERMDFWSGAIDRVANNLTRDDGSNPCLDTILRKNMQFQVTKDAMEVDAELTMSDAIQLGSSLGLSEEDLETCLWYMTYSLALHPMVCSLEPKTKVRTLCEDRTSDLSKCPVIPPESSPESSSTRTKLGSWKGIGTFLAILGFVSV